MAKTSKTKKHEVSISVENDSPKVPHFWRPLMFRSQEDRMQGGKTRLIGLELRMRDPFGMQEEVMMVPLNIELTGTSNAGMPYQFGPHTLHTSVGDVTIQPVNIPPSGL